MGTMIIVNATFVRQSPVNNSQAVDFRICPLWQGNCPSV